MNTITNCMERRAVCCLPALHPCHDSELAYRRNKVVQFGNAYVKLMKANVFIRLGRPPWGRLSIYDGVQASIFG